MQSIDVEWSHQKKKNEKKTKKSNKPFQFSETFQFDLINIAAENQKLPSTMKE